MSVLMEADPLMVVLRQTELIPETQLDRHLRGLPNPLEGDALLDSLTSAGLLTSYQVQCIRSGRIRDLELGSYRILDRLGSGTTGKVYLCEEKQTHRRVAVKVLDAEWSDRDPGVLTRFRREARACALLVHPNIVRAEELHEADGKAFLVMEYVEGTSLADLVEQGGPLPVAEAVEVIGQAALGLQHIHECGLIHRDVKPGNLLLSRDGQLKILDLGLARFTDSHDDLTVRQGYGVVGTLDYMAPEQSMASAGVDIRADIYALGATLHFVLTGEPPIPCSGSLSAKVMALQFRSAKPLSDYRADANEELQEILNRMSAKAPENRYPAPIDCARALNGWLEQNAVQAMAESLRNRPRRTDPPSIRKPLPKVIVERTSPKDSLLHQLWRYRWLAALAIVTGLCMGIALIRVL